MLNKQKDSAFNKEVYLLGIDTDKTRYWLEAPSWGFGYIATYQHNVLPSKARNIESYDHAVNFDTEWIPRLAKKTFTEIEGIALTKLFKKFYELKEKKTDENDTIHIPNVMKTIIEILGGDCGMLNKQKLAEQLEKTGEVGFTYADKYYNIFETDGGWMIDTFFKNKNEVIDGGLCTGSAMDAIEFMLPSNVKVLDDALVQLDALRNIQYVDYALKVLDGNTPYSKGEYMAEVTKLDNRIKEMDSAIPIGIRHSLESLNIDPSAYVMCYWKNGEIEPLNVMQHYIKLVEGR